MTPWFERVYHTEPPSEGDFEREHKSIELSDLDLLKRLSPAKAEIFRACLDMVDELMEDPDADVVIEPKKVGPGFTLKAPKNAKKKRVK